MERKATCVIPQPDKSPHVHYRGEDQEVWLGDIPEGIKVRGRRR